VHLGYVMRDEVAALESKDVDPLPNIAAEKTHWIRIRWVEVLRRSWKLC